MKSDDATKIGRHCFEIAGLGRAPFQFIGFQAKTYQACDDAPIQPGGSCAYCGQAIIHCCTIEDADGKRFEVGTTCVNKTGDKGMIRAYKQSVEWREYQREQRHAREEKKIAAGLAALDSKRKALAARPHPNDYHAKKGATLLDYVEWMFANAGNSGKCQAARIVAKA
jgi:hypothetical protein